MDSNDNVPNIGVVGLGYVGLPLAVSFSKEFKVYGFDISQRRIEQLVNSNDINAEVDKEDLENSNITFSSNFEGIKDCSFIIVTVPTPIDAYKKPDLSCLASASELIGKSLQKGSIVVFESTVYPGVTEEFCAPIIEKTSGLKLGEDFNIGYSPERINPGDKVHTVETVTKIISGDTPETLDKVEEVYSKIVKVGCYRAESIKAAEMAKVIENTQRDINIALVNEVAIICDKLKIRTKDVLEAAKTKWNFLKFSPGLVGGHCIGVDPYYLTFKCEELNYHPQMILSGRRINDNMGKYIAENTIKTIISTSKIVRNANVLVLGVTFKENIKDIRNSKVIDIVKELEDYKINLFLNDPHAEADQVKHEYDKELVDLKDMKDIDCIILAVSHNEYKDLTPEMLREICNGNPVFIDVKSMMNRDEMKNVGFKYWSL